MTEPTTPPETPLATPPVVVTTTTPPVTDKGFPENTPVVEMTVDQQAAYYKFQARKHEERATEYRTAVGGKSAAEVRAELEAAEEIRRAQMTDAERQLNEAREAARREAASEFGTRLVAAEFKAALVHVDEERREQIIGDLNLSKFLKDSGEVDTDKVKSTATAIAPADKDMGTRQPHDYGAGRRTDKSKSGVAAGAEAFAARKKTPPSRIS